MDAPPEGHGRYSPKDAVPVNPLENSKLKNLKSGRGNGPFLAMYPCRYPENISANKRRPAGEFQPGAVG
jgi:hypothetical protein